MNSYSQQWTAFARQTLETFLEEEALNKNTIERLFLGLTFGRREDRAPMSTGQHPQFYIPGITAKPWYDSSEFSWIPEFEKKYPLIKQEFLAVYSNDGFPVHPESSKLADQGNMAEFRFFSAGIKNEDNCQRCPETTAALTVIPGVTTAGSVFFSALSPGTHILPHYGPHNARIRCHLGLVVPPDCKMRVGKEARTWEEGRCLVFDDSIDHEVWNNSDSNRVILLFDVWHPELTADEIRALIYLKEHLSAAGLWSW